MTEQEAISVLKMIETHGSLPTNAKDEAIKALEEISKIKDIIREEERYEVSNSFDNPHPHKEDYDAVHADKFNRIWKVVSETKGE